jgi:hypothetical protein
LKNGENTNMNNNIETARIEEKPVENQSGFNPFSSIA